MQFTALNDYVTLPVITSLNVVRLSVFVENALQCDVRHEIEIKLRSVKPATPKTRLSIDKTVLG
jgi:hypothetical protein